MQTIAQTAKIVLALNRTNCDCLSIRMKNKIINKIQTVVPDYNPSTDIAPDNDNQCSEDHGWSAPVSTGGDGDGAAAGNIVRDVLCYMDATTAEVNDLPSAGWYRESQAINGNHIAHSGWDRVSDEQGLALFAAAVALDRQDRIPTSSPQLSK